MNKNDVFVVGVMSGTSLDGVDLVYVRFDSENYTDFEILHSQTIVYPRFWQEQLKNGINKSNQELKELDVLYGKFLGETINRFLRYFNIVRVDFIASHGHTILHQPKKGITLQIGSGSEIAKITNIKVVCDFRTQDVALGGQGAPLVPVGDELLFSSYDFCLNLGGFSNVSFKKEQRRIAFDICPVNIVLNYYAGKKGLQYDAFGKIASKGSINTLLLDDLNALDFYKKDAPKSLGLEWVQENIFPLIDECETDIEVILRTFVEHIAIQIAKVIGKNNSVLITGGGAFNTFLMDRIQYFANTKISLPSEKLINFKEALLFAFLGLLRVKNEVNCLKSVTGARKNHSSGEIFLA